MSGHNTNHEMYNAPILVEDQGDASELLVDRFWTVWPIESGATSETRTLLAPNAAGMICVVVLDTDGGGDVEVTVNGRYDEDGSSEFLLTKECQHVALMSVRYDGDSFRWQKVMQEGDVPLGMWSECPSPADPRYNSLCHEYFNDFHVNSDYDATNEWTATEDDAACTQALAADASNGILELTCKATTDDNGHQIVLNQESFLMYAGRRVWYEVKFATATGATQIDWTVGLVVAEDLTGVADNMPANGIVFHKDDGDTNVDLASCDNGSNTEDTEIGTWDTDFHILGFYIDGGASGSAVCKAYMDGTYVGTVTVTYGTMAELAPFFMVRNGDATTQQVMSVDYVKVVQLRTV